MTFRAGTPEMVGVGLLTFAGAVVAALVALFFRGLGCAWAGCSTEGLVQLLVACGGVITALGTFVESFRERGHPWRWFCVTALILAGWGLFVNDWVGG